MSSKFGFKTIESAIYLAADLSVLICLDKAISDIESSKNDCLTKLTVMSYHFTTGLVENCLFGYRLSLMNDVVKIVENTFNSALETELSQTEHFNLSFSWLAQALLMASEHISSIRQIAIFNDDSVTKLTKINDYFAKPSQAKSETVNTKQKLRQLMVSKDRKLRLDMLSEALSKAVTDSIKTTPIAISANSSQSVNKVETALALTANIRAITINIIEILNSISDSNSKSLKTIKQYRQVVTDRAIKLINNVSSDGRLNRLLKLTVDINDSELELFSDSDSDSEETELIDNAIVNRVRAKMLSLLEMSQVSALTVEELKLRWLDR